MSDENSEWEERKTCFVSLHAQGTDAWHSLRKCAITGSKISYYTGRGNPSFTKRPDIQARISCGVMIEGFDEYQIANMKRGTDAEPYVRLFDMKKNNCTIDEVGISVWKRDPRFRASMDGEILEPEGVSKVKISPLKGKGFVEYKVPRVMYRKLLDRVNSPYHMPGDYSHIFNSHYDQMIMNGVVSDKQWCRYLVVCGETGRYYQEEIPIDRCHWDKVLYPRACEFYDRYFTPVMEKHGLSLVNPPGLRV